MLRRSRRPRGPNTGPSTRRDALAAFLVHGDAIEALSSLDESFLHLETHYSQMHIGSVAIFKGPPPPYHELVAMVEAKLGLVPRYRQKIRFVPLAIGRSRWVDDPHFNLGYHLRHTALPSPAARSSCATSSAA